MAIDEALGMLQPCVVAVMPGSYSCEYFEAEKLTQMLSRNLRTSI